MFLLHNMRGHEDGAPISKDILRCLGLVQQHVHKYAVIAGGSSVAQVQYIEGRPISSTYGDVDIWIPRYVGGPTVRVGDVVTALANMSKELDGIVFDIEFDSMPPQRHGDQTKVHAYYESLHAMVDFKLSCDPSEPGGQKGYHQIQLAIQDMSSVPGSLLDVVESLVRPFDISIVKCAIVNEGGDVLLTEECRDDLAMGQFAYTVSSSTGHFNERDMATRIAKYVDRGFVLRWIKFGSTEGRICIAGTEFSAV